MSPGWDASMPPQSPSSRSPGPRNNTSSGDFISHGSSPPTASLNSSRKPQHAARYVNNGDFITWSNPKAGSFSAGVACTPRTTGRRPSSAIEPNVSPPKPMSPVPEPLPRQQREHKSAVMAGHAGAPSGILNKDILVFHGGERRLRRPSILGLTSAGLKTEREEADLARVRQHSVRTATALRRQASAGVAAIDPSLILTKTSSKIMRPIDRPPPPRRSAIPSTPSPSPRPDPVSLS